MRLNGALLSGLLLTALPTTVLAEPACEVAALRGAASSAGRSLAVGARLEAGAEIRTAAQGRVRLRCVDGSTVVLGDATTLRLTRFNAATAGTPRDVALWLEVGVMGQKVAPGGAWEVRTPTAVTAVRGTEFSVEVTPEQATAVHVQTGQVAVQSSRQTRGIKPAVPVQLDEKATGTQCDASGACSLAAPWSAERVKALNERLGGF
ncbi:MAG TPA: FecR family protein [Burkholderiaceae bacterium]